MIEVGSDSQFWKEDFWARYPNINIEDELMSALGVCGSCRASDGTYVCSLNVGHKGDHISLRDEYVVFEVPHGE
jgi:hypothetical protein